MCTQNFDSSKCESLKQVRKLQQAVLRIETMKKNEGDGYGSLYNLLLPQIFKENDCTTPYCIRSTTETPHNRGCC